MEAHENCNALLKMPDYAGLKKYTIPVGKTETFHYHN